MILVGLDDTDMPGTAGTNQLARRIFTRLPPGWRGLRIVRHQLLQDPRVPYTSRNGSASLWLRPPHAAHEPPPLDALIAVLRTHTSAFAPPGSDPALCVAAIAVAPEVRAFGRRCQAQLVSPREAGALAREHGLHLESLAGSDAGLVGALAAVGLAATGDDGRVVHLDGWPWPDDVSGLYAPAELRARGIEEVRDSRTERPIRRGRVRVMRRLRPALRGGRVVLYVERESGTRDDPGAESGPGVVWLALKRP